MHRQPRGAARGHRPPRRRCPLGRPRCREAAAPGPPGASVSFGFIFFLLFSLFSFDSQLRRGCVVEVALPNVEGMDLDGLKGVVGGLIGSGA